MMRKYGNIRDCKVRETLLENQWTWVLVLPRGLAKGEIFSRHRSYKGARDQARKLDVDLVEVAVGDTY